MSRNETHTLREGESLQIGDTWVIVRGISHDRATLKVIEPNGRRIQRVDRRPRQPVQLPPK